MLGKRTNYNSIKNLGVSVSGKKACFKSGFISAKHGIVIYVRKHKQVCFEKSV